MKIFFQNRLTEARRARISVFDHGFLYGDGIYETVRAYGGRVFRWAAHDARLRRSARGIGLKLHFSSGELLAATEKVLRANHLSDATVRICLSRGDGPLGLDPAFCKKPTLAILPHPVRPLEEWRARGVSAALVDIRRTPASSLSPEIKSTSALSLVLAKVQSKKRRAFEGILLNSDGYLTEGTISNLFFVRGRVLYTPSRRCGILGGITRDVVLSLAKKIKWPTLEGRYRPAVLLHADEIFLTNSSWEVLPVTRFHDGRRWRLVSGGQPGPRTRELQALFRRAVERETKDLLL